LQSKRLSVFDEDALHRFEAQIDAAIAGHVRYVEWLDPDAERDSNEISREWWRSGSIVTV
jgi:hypothetical protein